MLRTKTADGVRHTAQGARRTDIWITKSLPELSSGETKTVQIALLLRIPETFFLIYFVYHVLSNLNLFNQICIHRIMWTPQLPFEQNLAQYNFFYNKYCIDVPF